MKKLFITGGAGFIGYNCADFFLKKGFKIKIFDNISRRGSKINLKKILKNKSISFEKGDLKNFSLLNKSIKKFKPNLIINCAGQVAVTTSIKNPRLDFESNALGTFNLLETIRKNNLKTKLIHLSTNKVYGDMKNIKVKTKKKRYVYKSKKKGIDEGSQLDFSSPYGCSKGTADQYVKDYKKIYGIETYVVRQSCIYGPNQFGIEDQGWVAWITLCSLINRKINIFGNGKQVRDILYIDDLVNLFYKIYTNRKKISENYYNCGGGIKNSISILELIDILQRYNKKKASVTFKKERKADQKIFVSNNNNLYKDFHWYPKINRHEGVKKLYIWIKENLGIFKKIYNK
tara:strand:- start:2415 stop:3449 length:1035 start_codon:yes stop_codon:yes gene_type:complete